MRQLFAMLLDGELLGHHLELDLTKDKLINHVWHHYQRINVPTQLASLIDCEIEPYFSAAMFDYILEVPYRKAALCLFAKAQTVPQLVSGERLYRFTHSYHIQPHHWESLIEVRTCGIKADVQPQMFNGVVPMDQILRKMYEVHLNA